MRTPRTGRAVRCATILCGAFASILWGMLAGSLANAAPPPPPPASPSSPARVQPEAHTVTFVIDMRAEIEARRFDPARDAVGVRGGVAPLSWHETRRAADPEADGTYEVTVTFPRAPYGGQPVNYKFKVEHESAAGAGAGAGPSAAAGGGWETGRNRLLDLRAAGGRVARAFDSPPEPIVPSRVGDIRVHAGFRSRWLPPRDVQVWLPPGYEREPRRRYPVLYLHDGQNVFDAVAAGMEWQVDEAADALVRGGEIEPLIVVAVSNTAARTDEYTPTVVTRKNDDGSVVTRGGQAPLYGRFLVEELKPFIDRTYRTHTDAARTAVGGASHGGLVSLWLALEYPKVFGSALVLSPSAMWDDDVMIKRVAALRRRPKVRLWVDVGLLESESLVSAARRLRDALAAKGWEPAPASRPESHPESRPESHPESHPQSHPAFHPSFHPSFHYEEHADSGHDETAWASRVPAMLKFLWGTTPVR